MNSDTVILSKQNNVITISLNLPSKKNALVEKMKNELDNVLDNIRYDSDIKAIILTGYGDSFCAGGDLSSMNNMTITQGRDRMKKNHEWLMKLINIEKPVVAAINGPAIGAGLSLALSADILIASESAIIGAPFNKVGLIPDLGCLYLLTRYVGIMKAKELFFTGQLLSAKEAEKIGLVNKVVNKDRLLDVANDLASNLAAGPTYSFGLMKNIINRSYETNLIDILELEALAQAISYQTEDHHEGTRAFFEDRKPKFKGI